MSKKLDFNPAEKIVKNNKEKESNKNNDFKIYDVPWTFMTNDYIKDNIQILANIYNISIKEMVNSILLKEVRDKQDLIDTLKRIREE